MKVINAIKCFLICLIFLLGLVIVTGTMAAVKMFPDGKSGNKLIDYLLGNVTIQATATDDFWSEKYPYEKNLIEVYTEKVAEVKSVTDSYCTVSFPASETINDIVTWFKSYIYYYRVGEIPSLYENWNYVKEPVQNVVNLQTELSAMGIPFLYVQTPAQETIRYYNGEKLDGDNLRIAERSYSFTASLEEAGVNIINMGRDYGKGISYDTSSHWWPKDALNCASLIGAELNRNYGFHINESVYDKTKFVNLLDQYTEKQEEIEKNCGYRYEMLVPQNEEELEYELVYAQEYDYGRRGSFNEVLLKNTDEWGLLYDSTYHNMYRMENTLMYEITNSNAEEEKHVLVIGDSFNWPVSSYLSIGLRNLTVLHNASFSGSILNYIKQEQPDIVIMVYSDAEFWDVFTEAAYYLE